MEIPEYDKVLLTGSQEELNKYWTLARKSPTL